ncbi:MAG: L-histidine N(alpha)-methyltransferase [Rhodothermales bacterium]|nr:L-histidine N(alpha)-methyltransferase [Rhodothermales bacterium]
MSKFNLVFPSNPDASTLVDDARDAFLSDVLEGLERPQKTLPAKYFYDETGSQLFEAICELKEYYPTRTEVAIMQRYIDEIVALLGPRCLLIEYGSGSSLKTRILLDRLVEPAGYVPIDISGDFLQEVAAALADDYADLRIEPVSADYTRPFTLPDIQPPPRRRVVYFPGSTIGNFEPAGAVAFLKRAARVCGPGGGLLIGVDLQKDIHVLEAAYDDARGVTAAFNKNMLYRINCELGADFDPDRFHHRAVYNRDEGRIEMHLVSQEAQSVTISGRQVDFDRCETIHTENSYKYTPAQFARLAAQAGFAQQRVWTDDASYFSVQYLTVGGTGPA